MVSRQSVTVTPCWVDPFVKHPAPDLGILPAHFEICFVQTSPGGTSDGEMAIAVFTVDERHQCPVLGLLSHGRRDITNRCTDSSVVGRVGPGGMNQVTMMQRSLAGFEDDVDAVAVIHFHSNLLATGQ